MNIIIGSRSAAINLEARSILADNLIRRCAVVRGVKVNMDGINKAINDGLSGLLILIPKALGSITPEALQVIVVVVFNYLNIFDWALNLITKIKHRSFLNHRSFFAFLKI